MPRAVKLSEFEKGQIVALHGQGISNRQIAQELGRSPRVVNNFLNDPANYGTRKSTGRPSKLSERDTRRIWRKASNSVSSGKTIKDELGLNVHQKTIFRAIKKNPNLRRRKLKKAPAIKKENKQKRIDFARRNTRKDWTTVSHFVSILCYCLGNLE